MALINDAAPPNEALRQTKSTSIRREVCEAGVTAACSHHLRASVERTTWRQGGCTARFKDWTISHDILICFLIVPIKWETRPDVKVATLCCTPLRSEAQ